MREDRWDMGDERGLGLGLTFNIASSFFHIFFLQIYTVNHSIFMIALTIYIFIKYELVYKYIIW